jgi:hypothetical protein
MGPQAHSFRLFRKPSRPMQAALVQAYGNVNSDPRTGVQGTLHQLHQVISTLCIGHQHAQAVLGIVFEERVAPRRPLLWPHGVSQADSDRES